MNDVAEVWHNGRMVAYDQLRLSAFDLGLANGLGVFETMVAYDGNAVMFREHYRRLSNAVLQMKLKVPSADKLGAAIQETLCANGLQDQRGRVRITVLTGDRPLGAKNYSRFVDDHVIVSATEQQAPKASAKLVLSGAVVNERSATAGIKCTSYADNVLAYRQAMKDGADEAVMLNTRGQLCECSMSNIFLVSDGELHTPSLASGCLLGVTRGEVIRLAMNSGIQVHERELTENELSQADEIFITSSAREVQPASLLGSEAQLPGSVSKQMRKLYREMIATEIMP
ncbi:MAG: aminotransferase class IV [Akkermansiaceae bacterium]